MSEKQMQKRHIKEALALQRMALEKFETIDPQKLTHSEMIRFLTAGASLERIARKSNEVRVLSAETQDVIEDLRKIKEFFEK